MTAQDRLAVRVGAGMLIVIALAVAFLLVVDDVSLRRRISVEVALSHVGGLQEGAGIHIAGRVVGEIASIELARREGVILHAKIERRYAHLAPINGEWFVSSKGVFAERYLEIGAPAGGAAWQRTIRDGDHIRGVDPARLDRLTAISMRNFAAVRALTRELRPELDALSAALDDTEQLIDEIQPGPGRFVQMVHTQADLVDEIDATTDAWRGTGVTVDGARGLAARARDVVHRARGKIAALRRRIDALAEQLRRVRDRIDPARLAGFRRAFDQGRDALTRLETGLAVGEQLLDLVDRGQGTIGGFVHDHELRDFAKRIQRIIKRQGWDIIGHPSNRKLR